MLTSVNLDDKSFEQVLSEAMDLIPIYSREWTNYNPSDPGVTIIQNLTAFNVLQQQYINYVNDEIKEKLLKLLGFSAGNLISSTIILKTICDENHVEFLKNTKFCSGDIVFENTKPIERFSVQLAAAYTKSGNEIKDISHIVNDLSDTKSYLFYNPPKEGNEFYIILDNPPQKNTDFGVYIKIASPLIKRNAIAELEPVKFATIKWQYYSSNGWNDVPVLDNTNDFCDSGYVAIYIANDEPEIYTELPKHGYAIKAVLCENDYDIYPQIMSCIVNVFTACQQDTRIYMEDFSVESEEQKFIIDTALALQDNIIVLCKDSTYNEYYRVYSSAKTSDERGRCYTKTITENGIEITFSRKKHKRVPKIGKDTVRIICYDREYVGRSDLGSIYGYDDQMIETEIDGIVPEKFSLMIRLFDENIGYYFTSLPKYNLGDKNISYVLDQKTGNITIKNPDVEEENQLFITSCIMSNGAKGNIRESENFTIKRDTEEYLPYDIQTNSPVSAYGGVSVMDIEEIRTKFTEDMKTSTAAVTKADYEAIVKSTPGLIIHKVNAISIQENNMVKIAIKPYNTDKLPILTKKYFDCIKKHIDKYRLITSWVEIVQPKYVPIDVHGRIYIKQHYANSKDLIYKMINEELDFVSGEHSFGEKLIYSKIYAKIQKMDCVDYIYDLSFEINSVNAVKTAGADIQMHYDALCYMRKFNVEITGSNSLK